MAAPATASAPRFLSFFQVPQGRHLKLRHEPTKLKNNNNNIIYKTNKQIAPKVEQSHSMPPQTRNDCLAAALANSGD
jgi:hypothetical protein